MGVNMGGEKFGKLLRLMYLKLGCQISLSFLFFWVVNVFWSLSQQYRKCENTMFTSFLSLSIMTCNYLLFFLSIKLVEERDEIIYLLNFFNFKVGEVK